MAKELPIELTDRIKRDVGDLAGVFSRPGDDLNVLAASAFDAAAGDYRLAIATLKYWLYTDFSTRDPREFGLTPEMHAAKAKALRDGWQMWLNSPLPLEEPGVEPVAAEFPAVFAVASARAYPLPRSGV